ncbi:hypothetical protein BJ878DRAFT_296212 [Calycina marina]|uniref:Uncharacterized protein n=1 Tax=Calycina marina TaxID=1763456 RepID=A0A9P7YW69_9HELO|nr:hypothetical protein BJ878DRAFT_296212 [Calycina marina]
MSNENNSSESAESAGRARRGSFTTQTFSSIFGRSNSTAGAPTAPFPGPITTAAGQDQRRRVSISTLGLSGTSPTQTGTFAFGGRRGSVSTDHSDSIDESAIDDDDALPRSNPATPFSRRMSFGAQALRARTTNGGSPGTSGRTPSYTISSTLPTIAAGSRSGTENSPKAQASTQSKPRTTSDFPSARPGEGGFNLSEQLRSRAQSSVSQSQRPILPSTKPGDRAMSISEIPKPPTAAPAPAVPKPQRQQPDAFQERILKGDFYMD